MAAKPPEAPDLAALVKRLKELGDQVKEAFGEVADDVQTRFDAETARLLSKHPELYAELKRTVRQVKRTVDKAAESFGLK